MEPLLSAVPEFVCVFHHLKTGKAVGDLFYLVLRSTPFIQLFLFLLLLLAIKGSFGRLFILDLTVFELY